MAKDALSSLERLFVNALREFGSDLPAPEEQFLFAKEIKRKWRADFAFIASRVLVEIEGIYGSSRHRSVIGYHNDVEKYNAATLLGWRLIRFTSKHLRDDPQGCIVTLRKALES